MATHHFTPTHYHTTIGWHEPVLRIADGDAVITTTDAAGGTNDGSPHTDAPPRGTVSLSLHPTDDELIAVFAMVRGADGKHRFSANTIATAMGERRADVLA